MRIPVIGFRDCPQIRDDFILGSLANDFCKDPFFQIRSTQKVSFGVDMNFFTI